MFKTVARLPKTFLKLDKAVINACNVQIPALSRFHTMTGEPWRRPSSVPFPSVWRRFERSDKQNPQRIRKFRVQDIEESPVVQNAIIEHMFEHFLQDEPTCKALNLKQDAESVAESKSIWRSIFEHRIVLLCVEENEDGTIVKDPNHDMPKIVGCNMTYICGKGEKNPKTKGKTLSTICDAMDYVGSFMDGFEHYGVDKYMYAFGLSVDPAYRGMGIGTEILKARNDLGLKLGIKATVTTFTAIESQKTAERCGYEVLSEKSYEEIAKHDPRFTFPGIKTKTMKIMGRKLDVVLP